MPPFGSSVIRPQGCRIVVGLGDRRDEPVGVPCVKVASTSPHECRGSDSNGVDRVDASGRRVDHGASIAPQAYTLGLRPKA